VAFGVFGIERVGHEQNSFCFDAHVFFPQGGALVLHARATQTERRRFHLVSGQDVLGDWPLDRFVRSCVDACLFRCSCVTVACRAGDGSEEFSRGDVTELGSGDLHTSF